MQAGGMAVELVTSAQTPAMTLRKPGCGHAHQLVQNGEFELQFDCIDHRFYRSLAYVLVGIFQTDQGDVHPYAAEIDEDELDHYCPRGAVVYRAEHTDSCPDIDGRDDGFLDAEAGQLDPLHDIEFTNPGVGIGRVAAVGEDDRRDMKSHDIEQDQKEKIAKNFLTPDH